MGLVRNLRKIFSEWADITLAELCSAYIKQLAKQTTRKRNNSLSTECLQNNLTTVHQYTIIATSSHDISEKIIMDQMTTEDLVAHTREWSIDRLDNHDLSYEDQKALLSEFMEWIDPESEVEIMSLEALEEYYKD